MNATLLDTQVNTKDIKSLVKNIKDIKENSDGDFFENILKTLLSGIEDDKTKNFLLEKFLNSSKDLENFEKLDKILSTFSKGELKLESDDESSKIGEVLVEDLLKLSFLIKNDIDVKDFKTDSKELKMCCQDKTIVAEFKDAKNIKDLLQIAKKHDIKVKSFEFFKEELALNPVDQKSIQTIKSADVFKLIESKLKNSKENLIKTLKEDKTTVHTLKSVLSTIDDKKVDTKKVINHEVKDTKNVQVEVKETKQVDNKTKIEQNINTITKSVESKTKQQSKVVTLENDIEIKTKQQPKVVTLEKAIQTITKPQIKKDETKEIKTATTVDEKSVDIKEENIKNTLIKPIEKQVKVAKNHFDLKQQPVQNQNQQKEEIETKVKEIDNSSQEEKVENTHQTQTHKSSTIKQAPSHEVKRTLNTFAQDFKEQVESYKPPLMKVKMQLNPKGLGDVDVTMINRGNNLHITVTSNQNTISIFSQNQTDFKNSLVNMGFSELSMNFNENGKNKDEQNQKNKNQNSKDFENFSEEESFEMVTPLYV